MAWWCRPGGRLAAAIVTGLQLVPSYSQVSSTVLLSWLPSQPPKSTTTLRTGSYAIAAAVRVAGLEVVATGDCDQTPVPACAPGSSAWASVPSPPPPPQAA